MGQWVGGGSGLLWSPEAAEILAEVPGAPMTGPRQAGATETVHQCISAQCIDLLEAYEIGKKSNFAVYVFRTWFSGIRHTGTARRRDRRLSSRGSRGCTGGPRWTRQAASGRCPSRWRWTSGARSGPCAAAPQGAAAAAAVVARLVRDSSSEGPSSAARCFDEEAVAAASPRAPFDRGRGAKQF